MELQNLPVIDWDLAMKHAGNKREIAEEILALFMHNLPKDMTAINQSCQDENYQEMRKQLHKLHGALCYCGLPRLKTLVMEMELDLKNNSTNDLPELMETLNTEVNLLIDHYSH